MCDGEMGNDAKRSKELNGPCIKCWLVVWHIAGCTKISVLPHGTQQQKIKRWRFRINLM